MSSFIELKCLLSTYCLSNRNKQKTNSEQVQILNEINNKINTINYLNSKNIVKDIQLKYCIQDVLDEINKDINKQLVQDLISLLNIINNAINSKSISNDNYNNVYYNNNYSNNFYNVGNFQLSTNNNICDCSQSFSLNLGLER